MEKNPTLPLLYPLKIGEGRMRHGSRKTRTIKRMLMVKMNDCLHYIVLTHLGKYWAEQCLYDIICWLFSLQNSSSERYCVSSIGMNEWMHTHLGKKNWMSLLLAETGMRMYHCLWDSYSKEILLNKASSCSFDQRTFFAHGLFLQKTLCRPPISGALPYDHTSQKEWH